MRGLRDKRVLISGGSSGIGLATAQRFLEEGSRLFLAGLDRPEVVPLFGIPPGAKRQEGRQKPYPRPLTKLFFLQTPYAAVAAVSRAS